MPLDAVRKLSVVAIVFTCGLAIAGAEDARTLAQAPSGRVPFEEESTVHLSGLVGTMDLRVGKAEDLLFAAVLEGDRGQEIPIRVSTDGSSFFLRPAEGFEAERVEVQVVVPVGIAFEVHADGSTCTVSGTSGAVKLNGASLDARVRSVESVDADLEGGTLTLAGIGGDVNLRGRALTVKGGGIDGDLSIDLEASEADLEKVYGRISGSLVDSEWVIADARGGVELDVAGGGVDAAEIGGGGIFRMEEAYLRVTQSSGELNVQTDDELILEDNEASVHVDSFGGSVKAIRQAGLIEIVTDGTAVEMQDVSGALRIKGERLRLALNQLSGETILVLRGSEVIADGISAPLELYNEFGDVRISNLSERAKLETRDGSIYLSAVSGPLEIDADGEIVEIGWTSISREKDTSIVNAGGDIVLHLPKQGGGSFTATTKYGRIESDRLDVKIDSDGTRAVGILNRQRTPKMTVQAEGDLRIKDGAGGP